MEQVLNQTEGADPSADSSAENNTIEQKNTQNVGSRASSGMEGILQRTHRAGGAGTGAGVAVQTRGTKEFGSCGVGIYFAGDEALEVGIYQQSEIQLHDTPTGGQVIANPFLHPAHPNPMQDIHKAMALAMTARTPSKQMPMVTQARPAIRRMLRNILFLRDTETPP